MPSIDNYKKLLSEREQDLAERNEELEAQYEELSAAVEALEDKNQHLQRTSHQLNMLNREIDEIVYHTSHDLKGPITSLEGLFNLIEYDDTADKNEYLVMARKSTDMMKRILQMMVRYSNNLAKPLTDYAIDFAQLWSELLVELKQVDGFDEVKLDFNPKKISGYQSDPERIKLILFNLIKNGIDFRSVRNARVEVKISLINKELRIIVSDNGVGIPSSVQDNVFEMFYRGTNISKGSGLGLYLCKRTSEMMNGRIKLVSQEGIGTTVQVSLPNMKKGS